MREIRAIPVKCDNLERGCDWLGTVGDLEDHLTKCGSSPVSCPNKCKVDHLQLLRKSLKDHLETKCPNRAYNCEHCGLRGKYASIVGKHDEECEKKLISCLNRECFLAIERGRMKEHIQTGCKYTEVNCKFHSIGCKVRKKRMLMNQHEKEDDKAHLHMSLEMTSKLDSKLALSLEKISRLDSTLSSLIENTAKSLEKLDSTLSLQMMKTDKSLEKLESTLSLQMGKTDKSLEKLNSTLSSQMEKTVKLDKALSLQIKKTSKFDSTLSQMEKTSKLESTLSSQMEKTAKSLAKLDSTVSSSKDKTEKLDSTLSSMKIINDAFGSTTFKISEYGKKKGGNVIFHSQPFYTSPSGYKMCIRVHPNGSSEDKGSYVSVFIQLLEDPNDKSLHWPFLGTVEFKLLNQLADSGHHGYTLTLDTASNTQPGKSWGYGKFLPHWKLPHDSAKNTQYLMDNTLYFRATVTVKDPKPWLVCTHPST